jgi:hypothetical protein
MGRSRLGIEQFQMLSFFLRDQTRCAASDSLTTPPRRLQRFGSLPALLGFLGTDE